MTDFNMTDQDDDYFSHANEEELLQDEINSNKVLDIFMQLYQDNLNAVAMALMRNNFERSGAVIFLENTNNYEQELGVLIDPEAYIEAWVCLLDDADNVEVVFARFLLSKDEDLDDIHIIWGSNFNIDEFLNEKLNETALN